MLVAHVKGSYPDNVKAQIQENTLINKVTIGMLLSLGALFLLHGNQIVIGLPLFIVGIYLMIKKKH